MMNRRHSLVNLVKSAVIVTRFSKTSAAASLIGQSSKLSTSTAPSRVFTQYALYKEKAALSVSPVCPTLVPVTDYAKKIKKDGSVVFELTPANSSGNGVFDWHKKVIYRLYPVELGSLITCDLKKGLEFTQEYSLNGRFTFLCYSGTFFYPLLFFPPAEEENPGKEVTKTLKIRANNNGAGNLVCLPCLYY
jgi:hypothetical protein